MNEDWQLRLITTFVAKVTVELRRCPSLAKKRLSACYFKLKSTATNYNTNVKLKKLNVLSDRRLNFVDMLRSKGMKCS